MAEKHKPKKGPHHRWVYPQSTDVLQECGINTILHYIDIRRNTIFQYVLDQPNYDTCREGEQQRGLPLQQWWWELKMCLDNKDADGADK
jgi:L-rhamnose mutarotase